MAEASLSAEESLNCPICLDLPKDPVTIACGHSYCMCCIKSSWDQDDQKGGYSCPQCRETFPSRPVLKKNTMLAELAEKLRKRRLQAVLSPDSYAKPGDVKCDVCTGRKLKAVKSCLVCLISFCETHLQTHLESPAYEKHRLVEASTKLQHKICPQHDKLLEIYCRTDHKMICYFCVMDEHKGHDTVSAAAERADKQRQLEKTLRNSQQRIRKREKELQELKQVVKSLKFSAQTAVEDSVKIFTEMLRSIERKCSEVIERIRAQEKAELSQVQGHIKKLEQELADLRKRDSELEQLSHTEDHIHFLQDFQTLSVCSGYKDLPSIIIKPVSSFDDVKKSVSEMKIKLKEFFSGDVIKASGKDSRQVTLGASMACKELHLSEENSKMAAKGKEYDVLSPAELAKIKEALVSKDLATAVREIQDDFEQQGGVELNIAVTGESGSGKSTFVNAFRGLGDEDKGSAPTGVVETTMKPEVYPHPKYPNVKMWDLPGIGTPNFKADKYLEEIGFQRYDFFIIVSSDRFRECHAQMANEINKMKKKFYFIQSKIDNSMRAESRKKNFNKERTLDAIRSDCIKGLQSIGVSSPDVFLISSHYPGSYDFGHLEDTIERELSQHKRQVLRSIYSKLYSVEASVCLLV